MKTVYREHEIEVSRMKSVAGNTLLFWHIYREEDRFECDSGFLKLEDSDDSQRLVSRLKERVDNELAKHDPWAEDEPACNTN